MIAFTAVSGILAVAKLAVVYVVGRWAYREHQIVAGYWFLGWIAWGALLGLLEPLAMRVLVDEFLVPAGWRIGQAQAISSYSATVLTLIAKLALLLLIVTDLIHALGTAPSGADGAVGRLRSLYPYRHRIGVLSLLISSVHPMATLMVLVGFRTGWLG